MFSPILHSINEFRARCVTGTSAWSAAFQDIPATLYPYWKRNARLDFRGIPQDAFFFVLAAEGLLMFFECVKQSGKPCALPSKAADSVWHAWSRMSPDTLDAFCIKHFGRAMPHLPAANIAAQMEDALATCLAQARALDGLPRGGKRLPRLFALDARLRMPGGFSYRLIEGEAAFACLDWAGKPKGDVFFPSMLAPVELLIAGAMSQAAYDDYVRRVKDESFTSGGVGAGSVV